MSIRLNYKVMQTRFVFLVIAFMIMLSCEKDPDPIIGDIVPVCILEKIEEFKTSAVPCSQKGPSVIEYEFQGDLVYAFDMGQCVADGSSIILNEFCEELCILGTIIGITDCLGEPFANATEIRVIWEE